MSIEASENSKECDAGMRFEILARSGFARAGVLR